MKAIYENKPVYFSTPSMYKWIIDALLGLERNNIISLTSQEDESESSDEEIDEINELENQNYSSSTSSNSGPIVNIVPSSNSGPMINIVPLSQYKLILPDSNPIIKIINNK